MNIQIPYNFTPRPYQLEFFAAMSDGADRAMLRWHRRAGKDKACWCYMIYKASIEPGNYYYIFPTAAQGRKALWESIDSDGFSVMDHIPTQLGARINKQEMFVSLPTADGRKSSIQIIGLDKNKDGIRGVSCKGAIFSEFAYQDEDAYKTLMPSIRETKGWCIFNSTPQGNNHMWVMEQGVKKAIEDARIEGTKSRWYFSHLQTLYSGQPGYSGLVTEKNLKEIQDEEGLTDQQMATEFGASYDAGMIGSIYGHCVQQAREEGRIGDYPYDNNFPVHTAWDLGFSVTDPTSIWVYQIINGTIRFIDYFEEFQETMHSITYKVLSSKPYDYIEHNLPHDSDNKSGHNLTRTEELRSALRANGLKPNVRVIKKTKSLKNDIEACRAKFSICTFNLATVGSDVEDLTLYHNKWDPKRRSYIKEPVHDDMSHRADAFRTCIMAGSDLVYSAKAQPRTIDSDYDIFS